MELRSGHKIGKDSGNDFGRVLNLVLHNPGVITRYADEEEIGDEDEVGKIAWNSLIQKEDLLNLRLVCKAASDAASQHIHHGATLCESSDDTLRELATSSYSKYLSKLTLDRAILNDHLSVTRLKPCLHHLEELFISIMPSEAEASLTFWGVLNGAPRLKKLTAWFISSEDLYAITELELSALEGLDLWCYQNVRENCDSGAEMDPDENMGDALTTFMTEANFPKLRELAIKSDGVAFEYSETDGKCEGLFPLLEKLTLSGVAFDIPSFKYFGRYGGPNVKEMTLRGCGYPEYLEELYLDSESNAQVEIEQGEAISQMLPPFPKLRSLSVFYSHEDDLAEEVEEKFEVQVAKVVRHTLEELHLPITHSTVAILKAGSFEKLQTLKIGLYEENGTPKEEGYDRLFYAYDQVEEIEIAPDVVDLFWDALVTASAPKLNKLLLNFKGTFKRRDRDWRNPPHLSAWARRHALPALKKLEMWGLRIDEDAFIFLAHEIIPKLTSLKIDRDCHLIPGALATAMNTMPLGRVSAWPYLKHLFLGAAIHAGDFESLLENCDHLPELESLNITMARNTDDGYYRHVFEAQSDNGASSCWKHLQEVCLRLDDEGACILARRGKQCINIETCFIRVEATRVAQEMFNAAYPDAKKVWK